MKVGLFLDAPFRRQNGGGTERVWAGDELFGFASFAAAVGSRLGGMVLISRGTSDAAATPYELPPGLELAPLPYYRSLRQIGELLRAMPATAAALWRALGRVDAVWVSAANPVGLLVIALAALRRRRVLILVRQDTMRYFRSRLPSRLWAPMLIPLWMVDLVYRLIARRVPTVVVGAQIARRYRAPRPNVLEARVNLVSERDIPADPEDAPWDPPVRLLTVGRVEPEKSPQLLAEALALLERERPGRFQATWAGSGRLLEPLRERADSLGVGGSLHLPGYVPMGPELLKLYREADVFVHIAQTEGVPGVVIEALASGIPAIATDVGGVRDAVDDGRAALLVAPGDAEAIASAVLRLDGDPGLRHEIAATGLDLARRHSLEAEADRVAAFVSGGGMSDATMESLI